VKKAKHIVSSFSYPQEKDQVIYEANIIAARERKSFSEFVFGILEDYVKAHAAGNPNFELTKWQEDPNFTAVPALLESPEKWEKYLDNCSIEDMARIQGMARFIDKEVKDQTFKKKLSK
jgi:hypothetical protein